MAATSEPPASTLKISRPRLLGTAGILVLIVALAGHMLSEAFSASIHPSRAWHFSLSILMGLLLLAIAFGAVALARPARQNLSCNRIHTADGFSLLILSLLITFHILMALLILRNGSGVATDVYTFQRDACKNLLHGIDPFGATQADNYDARYSAVFYSPGWVLNGRVLVGLQYPPLTLLTALPGYLLGDVRIGYVLAVLISALLLFALSPGPRGLGLASVLLLSPLTFLIEFLCYTEPLAYVTLCATMYAAMKKRWWLPIALGLFLASKQYNILALPLIAYFIQPFQWKAYCRLAGLSLATAAVTVLPFAIWDPRALWHDLVLFHLAQPFRPDSLSFTVLFPWIVRIGPVLVLGFILWALRAKIRSAAMFPVAYGIALLLFFSTSKQAFANYYFLVGHAFFLSIAALPAASAQCFTASADTAKLAPELRPAPPATRFCHGST